MLKVIVVEDEDIIREGIAASIEEAGSDFIQVVRQAGDGEEALELVKEHQPDVVITDIKMPFMDGLTLLETVRPLYPEMFVIILSGHDEFEYARRALKAGAYDYILKPVKVRDLMDVLYNIQMEAEERTLQKSRLESLEKDSREHRRRQYLSGLMLGKAAYNAEDADAALLKPGCYAVGISDIEDFALLTIGCDYLELIEMDTRFEKLVNAVADALPQVTVLKKGMCEVMVCAYAGDKAGVQAVMAAYSEGVRKESKQELKVRTCFGTGADSPAGLHNAYMAAVREKERGYLRFDELVSGLEAPGNIQYMDFDDRELLSAVRAGDREQMDAQMTRLEEQMREQKVISQLHMIMVAARIYFDVGKLLAEVSYNPGEALVSNLEHFNQIISQSTPEAVVARLRSYCHNVADFLQEVNSGKFARVLGQARDFIQNNFMNENLMLEDVAQHVYISSSYLCIIFKKEAGETFIEYLTRVRMEHAARLLLETDMKNYEIAEACGYSNPTYFSTIFKKYYDLPPSIYKAQNSSESI